MIRIFTLLAATAFFISSAFAQQDPRAESFYNEAKTIINDQLQLNGLPPTQNFVFDNEGNSSSSPLNAQYSLDSTRLEVYDFGTTTINTRRTTVHLTLNDSTERTINRSWGNETFNYPNNEVIITTTSTGSRSVQYSTDLTTNTNTKQTETVLVMDPVLHQNTRTTTSFDAQGNVTTVTYALQDSAFLANDVVSITDWETDATFTPISFVSRILIAFDARDRTKLYAYQTPDYTTTDLLDSAVVVNITTVFTDGQGDDYTYVRTREGFNGRPDVIETGSYTYTANTIVQDYDRRNQGDTTVVSSVNNVFTLDTDGNTTSIVSAFTSGTNVSTSRSTYSYIPGTNLVTEIDNYNGSPLMVTRLERRFYTQQASNTNEAIPTANCKLQAGNVGPASFLAANASFTGTYQLLDLQGRVLQTTTRQKGQLLDLTVPTTSGLYYLVGHSANERCVTKLVR